MPANQTGDVTAPRAQEGGWTVARRIVDLSLPVQDRTASPPSQSRQCSFETVRRGPDHWQATWISLSVHTASHVDSPLHCLEGAPPIDHTPLDRLVGRAVVLDLRSVHPEQGITAEFLAATSHSILDGDMILLHTGWSDRKFGDPDYFVRSPFLTDEAAHWLVARKPKAVGFDFFQERAAKTIDFKPEDFTTHRILMKHGITIIEGLTNLGALEGRRATFFAAPLKLAGAEAAPARLFAIVED